MCGTFASVEKFGAPEEATAGLSTMAKAVEVKPRPRVATDFKQFDDLTSGGIPKGATAIISGPPGAGKTTLGLILCAGVARGGKRALYASAEEPLVSLLEKAQRCGFSDPNVALIGNEDKGGDVYSVAARAEKFNPAFMIFDSIQEMFLDDCGGGIGSTEQMLAVLEYLRDFCAREKIACVIMSHVNRSGEVRGPTTLDHRVEAMLEFDSREKEGKNGELDEKTRGYRKLSLTMKTRIGRPGSCYFNMNAEGVVEPLSEETYFGKKRSNLVSLAEKYRPKLVD